jgi:hypothetical protein
VEKLAKVDINYQQIQINVQLTLKLSHADTSEVIQDISLTLARLAMHLLATLFTRKVTISHCN